MESRLSVTARSTAAQADVFFRTSARRLSLSGVPDQSPSSAHGITMYERQVMPISHVYNVPVADTTNGGFNSDANDESSDIADTSVEGSRVRVVDAEAKVPPQTSTNCAIDGESGDVLKFPVGYQSPTESIIVVTKWGVLSIYCDRLEFNDVLHCCLIEIIKLKVSADLKSFSITKSMLHSCDRDGNNGKASIPSYSNAATDSFVTYRYISENQTMSLIQEITIRMSKIQRATSPASSDTAQTATPQDAEDTHLKLSSFFLKKQRSVIRASKLLKFTGETEDQRLLREIRHLLEEDEIRIVISDFMISLKERRVTAQSVIDVTTTLKHFCDGLFSFFWQRHSNYLMSLLIEIPLTTGMCSDGPSLESLLWDALEFACILPFQSQLLIAYGVLYKQDDQKLVEKVTLLQSISQEQLGIHPMCTSPDGYSRAISAFSGMQDQPTPRLKLGLIVKAAACIYEEYEQNFKRNNPGKDIRPLGAEEIFPIFLYLSFRVLVRQGGGGPGSLSLSLLEYLSRVVSDSILAAELGYFLCTLRAAMEFIITTDANSFGDRMNEDINIS